jgi:hypothetical protein
MKGRRASSAAPGPQRWKYRQYSILERRPLGRRFEVRSPNQELVLVCRSKAADPSLVFYADDDGSAELFRFVPQQVRQFQQAYEAVDALTQRKFGEVRKRVYEPSGTTEWFVFDADGNQIGLVTQTASSPSLLRRLLPVERATTKAWALHWGQTVAGTVEPHPGLIGERVDLDLKYDARDEVDRRLALGVAIALRADLHRGARAGARPRGAATKP